MRTLDETPRVETHWSSRGMAKATGLGRTTVQQIWRAFGLQPHRTEPFQLSTDPLLIDKVRDIVGPTHAVVCWMDEKSPIRQWIARHPSCRCARGRLSDGRTTPDVMAPRRCWPHST